MLTGTCGAQFYEVFSGGLDVGRVSQPQIHPPHVLQLCGYAEVDRSWHESDATDRPYRTIQQSIAYNNTLSHVSTRQEYRQFEATE